MKNKLIKAVCLFGVFIASFMLTVTAFAYNNSEMINTHYYGVYKCMDQDKFPESLINIREDGYLQIKAYMDLDYMSYFSGFSTNWAISNSGQDKLWAEFDSVTKVYRDGSLVKPLKRQDNYYATGGITIMDNLPFIVITSNQSDLAYISPLS